MTTQKPIVNAWYVNQTGKLVKVRMLDYEAGNLAKVLIEYLEGNTILVGINDWNKLDLHIHAWMPMDSKSAKEI
ncbi:MAG: hypothetical protein GXP19_03915 [Gammaproteobacteria bacterium]|nr:hypothetical protein [Gammaproteobacteria bacterium]